MDYLGKYKVSSIHAIFPTEEGISTKWVSPEEYIQLVTSEDDDPRSRREAAMMINALLSIEEDGHYYTMMPIPEEASKEEIDKAVESGMIKIPCEGYMIMSDEEPGDWEVREDGFYTKSGVKGSTLGVENDPWVKSDAEDGDLVLGNLIQIKYTRA